MIEQLQAELGYEFNDVTLLEQAITHRSYLNENPSYTLGHNERLEFLGDAVLQLIASDLLFDRFVDMSEGRMTRIRGWLVRTETLASFARKIQLGSFLRMARGEEIDGGRDRDSMLCNAFEAIIGAMYLDSDLETVRQFILPYFEDTLAEILARQHDKDPKSLFQEWAQALFRITPTYTVLEEIETAHKKQFRIGVVLDNVIVGEGEGRSKQAAEQAAASHAIKLASMGALPFILD